MDKKLDAIEASLKQRQTEEQKLKDRVAELQVDPAEMLERVGLFPSAIFAAVTYNDQLYLLPKSQQSYNDLLRRGYPVYQLSPILSGFMAAPAAVKANPPK